MSAVHTSGKQRDECEGFCLRPPMSVMAVLEVTDDHLQSLRHYGHSHDLRQAMPTVRELLDALIAAEERDEQKQSFAEVEELFRSGGTSTRSEHDYEYYRRSKQRAAIAKAAGEQP